MDLLNPDLAGAAFYTVFGFTIGIISAAFGVGGGFAYFPFFTMAAGFSAASASATSSAQIPFNSLSGFIGHLRKQNVARYIGTIYVLGAVPGALLGAELLLRADTSSLDSALKYLYVAINGLAGFYVLRSAVREKAALEDSAGADAKPTGDGPAILSGIQRTEVGLYAAAAGFLSVLIGIGGGTFTVPYLMLRYGLSPRRAIGTSVMAMFFFTTAISIRYGLSSQELVAWQVVLYLVIGSAFGAQLGARLVSATNPRLTKFVFGGFQLLLAAVMLADHTIGVFSFPMPCTSGNCQNAFIENKYDGKW